MSGGYTSTTTDTATTPGRKTHFRFDVTEYVAQQPTFSIEREMEAIVPVYSESTLASKAVEFVPGLGWRLASIHADANQQHELGAPILAFQTPANYSNKPTWAPSTLTGATYSAGVTSSGDMFYSRDFAANGNLTDGNYNLVSDQGAVSTGGMPTPYDGTSNAPLYRVGLEQGGPIGVKEITHCFEVRGNPKDAPDIVNTRYFNGPQGWEPNASGYQNTGYYCIGFRGDGRCELWVWLSNGTPSAAMWTKVRTAWYCDPSQVHNRVHRVIITPIQGRYPNVSGGSILFRFTNAANQIKDPPSASYMGLMARTPGDTDLIGAMHFKWTAPGIYGTQAASALPNRVDSRQDLDVQWQGSQVTYQTSGVLLDQLFQLPFLPDATQNFTVSFWGQFPVGCSILCSMYNATTDVPTPGYNALTIASGGGAANSQFVPVAGNRFYGVHFAFTGTGTDTPVLQGYRVFRNGVMIAVSPGEFEPAAIPSGAALRTSTAFGPLSIDLADNDPSRSSATFAIDDLAGDMTKLQARGDFPVVVETEYDTAHPSYRVKWHRGYARLPESEEVGNHAGGGWNTGVGEDGPLQSFNYGKRFKVQVTCTGAWQRLEEALLPCRYNFAVGNDSTPTNIVPARVTDAMKTLLYFAGYDDSQISIPTLESRLFPSGDADGLVLEPQTPIHEVLTRWTKEYFGGYLYFEPNSGTYGKWYLLRQQIAPYNFLAYFTGASPGAGKIQNSLASYGTITVVANPPLTTTNQTMVQAPMFKRSVKWTPRPPEANAVTTYGPSESGGGESAGLLCQVAFNTSSFQFSGFPSASAPDPTSSDWLSRPRMIWQYLPTFAYSNPNDWSSPLSFATRRTYDVSCRGRLGKVYASAAVIVQDPVEGFMRPLRFYDLVYVEGIPCIVRGVNMHYVKDDHQICAYTVEQLIGGVPAQVSRTSGITSYRDAMRKVNTKVFNTNAHDMLHFASEKRDYGMQASVLSIGVKRTGAIQNANGTFIWMMDYDPAG